MVERPTPRRAATERGLAVGEVEEGEGAVDDAAVIGPACQAAQVVPLGLVGGEQGHGRDSSGAVATLVYVLTSVQEPLATYLVLDGEENGPLPLQDA